MREMKLYIFVILVAVLVTSRAEEERCVVPTNQCTNAIACEACEEYLNQTVGCTDLGVRLTCRAHCNVCEGFEQHRPRGDIAVVYGGYHVITWDRLPFDVTASGEFVLYTNARTGMKVHALMTRPDGVRNPVTTAVAAVDGYRKPKLQIAIDLDFLNERKDFIYDAAGCKLLYWVGDREVSKDEVRRWGGFGGLGRFYDPSGNTFVFKIELPSGARVSISLRHGDTHGCYFDHVNVLLNNDLTAGTRGLLGTPDNNLYNEWHGKNGNSIPLPNRVGRHLAPAYNYARNNWCVKSQGASIINYTNLGSFAERMRCNEAYTGLTDFSSSSPRAREVFGQFNYEALHEALSSGLIVEGMRTINMMEAAERATVPEFKNGLNVQPRGVRANEPWTVTAVLKSGKAVPGLNGFGLFELNEDNLSRTNNVVAFLTDAGDNKKGDAKRLDRLYTDQLQVTLGNGHSRGFAAVPLIDGVYQFGRRDLIVTMPQAVRGYSEDSMRTEALAVPDGGKIRQITLDSIQGINIDVSFQGPEDREPLIVGAKFLDQYVGDHACGADARETNYLNCTKCEAGALGDTPTVTFRLWKALRDGLFSASTELFFEGFFLGSVHTMDDPPSVPAKVKVTVRRGGKGETPRASLEMDIQPKEKILDDPEASYCTKEFPETLLGAVKVVRNVRQGTWEISLAESHVI